MLSHILTDEKEIQSFHNFTSSLPSSKVRMTSVKKASAPPPAPSPGRRAPRAAL